MPAYHHIVVLTGAGISAESGIRTFRAADGLWEEHRIEDVASPQGFRRDPALVQRFYNLRRQQLQQPSIVPNAAHVALADFENSYDGDFLLITQNIDNLHERAGTQNLIHMHGELLKARCTISEQLWDQHDDITPQTRCQCCDLTGTLRPHVVWFGEMPLQMEAIHDALMQCDLFISIGTSGNVYPAAGFVMQANDARAHTVELNLEPSLTHSDFREAIHGPATEVVPAFLASLLS